MEELGNQVMDTIRDFFRLSFADVRPVDVVRGIPPPHLNAVCADS
jgi:hypothetical protein